MAKICGRWCAAGVDGDEAALVHHDAGGVEPDALAVRAAPDRDQHLVEGTSSKAPFGPSIVTFSPLSIASTAVTLAPRWIAS
jgi:hypothetical protein